MENAGKQAGAAAYHVGLGAAGANQFDDAFAVLQAEFAEVGEGGCQRTRFAGNDRVVRGEGMVDAGEQQVLHGGEEHVGRRLMGPRMRGDLEQVVVPGDAVSEFLIRWRGEAGRFHPCETMEGRAEESESLGLHARILSWNKTTSTLSRAGPVSLNIRFEAGEIAVGDDVDHTADGIGPVDRRGAVLQDLDAVDHVVGQRVEIHCARHAGCGSAGDPAPAVDQDQRTNGFIAIGDPQKCYQRSLRRCWNDCSQRAQFVKFLYRTREGLQADELPD